MSVLSGLTNTPAVGSVLMFSSCEKRRAPKTVVVCKYPKWDPSILNVNIKVSQIPNNVLFPLTEPWTKDIGPQRQKARRGRAWVVPHIWIPTQSCLSINACKLGSIFVFVNTVPVLSVNHKLQTGFQLCFFLLQGKHSYSDNSGAHILWHPFFLLLFYSTQLRTSSWRLEVHLQHLSPS